MLFHVVYTFRDAGEEGSERALRLFQNWQPPAGFEFKVHYQFADGSGGMNIVEAESAVALLQATGAFAPYMDFELTPIVTIEEGVAAGEEAIAFRAGVS